VRLPLRIAVASLNASFTPLLQLQDCVVGLLFAFMPVLAASGGSSGFDVALLLTVMGRVVLKLAVLVGVALVVARVVLPPTMRALQRRFGPDSFQLAAIAFCLVCALATAKQGISGELGAFAAGIMLSATDQQEAVLHHLGERRFRSTAHPCPCALRSWDLLLLLTVPHDVPAAVLGVE
jgi:Kef-type K+ transport system membrane component KefB